VNTGELLKVNIKTIYLRKDSIATEMLAIYVSGPLDYIRAAQLAEKVFVAWCHLKGGKDLFICRVPSSKSANSETIHVAGFALSFKEGFKVVVFDLFAGNSFLHGFGAVLKGATDVDDGNLVIFLYYNVRSNWRSTILDSFISGDGSRANSIGQAVDNLVVASGDGRHVSRAVAEQVRQGFVSFAVAAGGRAIRPAAFDGIGGEAV
jgi:hypothetical protein